MVDVERTFVFLKPEAVLRGLMGEILARMERRGLRIRALKLHRMTREEAERLYEVHKGKEFFERLVEHVTSGPVLLMVVEGPRAVSVLRRMIGATDPLEAQPGTIRGDSPSTSPATWSTRPTAGRALRGKCVYSSRRRRSRPCGRAWRRERETRAEGGLRQAGGGPLGEGRAPA